MLNSASWNLRAMWVSPPEGLGILQVYGVAGETIPDLDTCICYGPL